MGMLDERVAIITGASKGIGRVMSQWFAREGAKVVCAARSAELVREVVDDIERGGGQAVAAVADAGTEDGARAIVAAAVQTYGRVTALVNNAGDSGPTKPVEDYSTAEWEYTLNSCLTSTFLCAHFAVPEIVRAGGGSIVNVSSMAGRRGMPYRVGYCAAKAGQIGLTRGLAVELGRHNITVNAILPGAVAGDRMDRAIAGQAGIRGVSNEVMRKSFTDRLPLGRMVDAEDIASLAVFLCSDQARNLSGQCIPVNAGEPAT